MNQVTIFVAKSPLRKDNSLRDKIHSSTKFKDKRSEFEFWVLDGISDTFNTY